VSKHIEERRLKFTFYGLQLGINYI